MSYFKLDKKEEEDISGNPFQNLDKTIVLQDARYFNQTPVNPRKCIHILTKILYLLNQGQQLSTQEATEAFFATTKLFQSKDMMLRRMMYLCIKELSTLAQDVIIVTSSLTKDMTGKEDQYRAPAIRALCSITDTSMLQAIERYMKQAIVDKNTAVSSAALVSTLHLSGTAPELVKRWANEAQEAMSSDNGMVAYHALGVVAAARKDDKLSTMKLVLKSTQTAMKSPYALCLLIRLSARLVTYNEDHDKPYIGFIERCLTHKSEIVIYEAARALVTLNMSQRKQEQAVSVLQLFCGSSKPSLRLAGARTLALLTDRRPDVVASCAVDLENLISDSNRSIATVAVTTLLATGNESSIDRLMKQITSFVSEISDEFKIIVVREIKKLCVKFPRKHHSIAQFLATMLREEGGLGYKAAIADALIALVEENPEAKETGLAHLCEFIEDCEHTILAVRILHLLGREGPKSRQPSRYIRFIYNRVILESGPVRAAAVSAVAQFGAQRPELLPNIRVLLQRCQLDEEDEVRDRAVYYSAILDSADPQLINDYIINVPKPNPVLLEKALRDHLATRPSDPFDILSIPREKPRKVKQAVVETRKPQVSLEERYLPQLAEVPGIERLGPLFKTIAPQDLTEPETEYLVRVVKHVFARHIVLQFECLNTIPEQWLEEVEVRLRIPHEMGYELKTTLSCELRYNKPGSVFTVLEFPCALLESIGSIEAWMEFVIFNCDDLTGAKTGGVPYNEMYQLEAFDIECSDQIRARVGGEDFVQLWDRAVNVPEVSETFGLPENDVTEAARKVCEHIGLPKEAIVGDAVKEIRVTGFCRGGAPFLLRAKLAAGKSEVTIKLAVRSPREDVALLIIAAMN